MMGNSPTLGHQVAAGDVFWSLVKAEVQIMLMKIATRIWERVGSGTTRTRENDVVCWSVSGFLTLEWFSDRLQFNGASDVNHIAPFCILFMHVSVVTPNRHKKWRLFAEVVSGKAWSQLSETAAFSLCARWDSPHGCCSKERRREKITAAHDGLLFLWHSSKRHQCMVFVQ